MPTADAKPMTAETDLLPMPGLPNIGAGGQWLGWSDDDMHTYARACVSSATEALRERMRTEDEAAEREIRHQHARAERLAEAGRRVTAAFRAHGKSDWMDRNSTRDECEAAMLALDAVLEQEKGRG